MRGSKLQLSDREKDATVLCLIKQKQNPKYLSSGFSDLESMSVISSCAIFVYASFSVCVYLLRPLSREIHDPKDEKKGFVSSCLDIKIQIYHNLQKKYSLESLVGSTELKIQDRKTSLFSFF